MFDVTALDHRIRSEKEAALELEVNREVVASLTDEKEAALARLEEAKSDLNAIDAAIAERTPRVEEEETTEEAQG